MQGAIDFRLVQRVKSLQRRSDHFVDVLNCLQNSLAAVSLLVAVAKLNCFVFTG